MTQQQDIIPTDLINEGVRGAFELMPLVYIIIVIMAVIGFGIVNFRGESIKYYRIWVMVVAAIFAAIAYFLLPQGQINIRNIPTLIIGAVASLFFIELFIFWRKKK